MSLSNDCGLTLENVYCVFPSCDGKGNDGAIVITASGKGDIEYSIDGGTTYLLTPQFDELPPGAYEVVIRFIDDPKCEINYGVVELPAPLCEDNCIDIEEGCGTVLFPGDLTFVGFDNNIHYGNDWILIATIVDLKKFTFFSVTNAIYEGGASAGVHTNYWHAPEDNAPIEIASHRITYVGEETIPAGSIICFDLPSHNSGAGMLAQNFKINGVFSSDFCVRSDGNSPHDRVNISTTKPDALFLFQGEWTFLANHATLCGRVLSGIQNGGEWLTSNDTVPWPSRNSRTHPHLAGLSILGVADVVSGAYYFTAQQATSYTPLDYLRQATDFTTWEQVAEATPKNDIPTEACQNEFQIDDGGPNVE